MALFITDLHSPLHPYMCLPKAALYIPSMKNLLFSANMTRTSENLPISQFTGMYSSSRFTMLEKIGLHLWDVIRNVIHHFVSVGEFLNSKVFLMCAGETVAIMGKSKKTVGLEAQENPGWESRNVEPTNMDQKTSGSNPQIKIMEDPMTQLDNHDGDEVVLSDWLQWESEEEEDYSDGGDLEEDKAEQSSEDEEDSDWSDDEDSEASTESAELWESFLHHSDPYNPLYFSCPTGIKAKSKDITKNSTTSSPPVSELKSVPAAAVGHVPEERAMEGTKKVRFSEEVKVHHLVTWASASQAARDGSCWLEMARDRERFRRRVERTGEVLNPCLTPEHRTGVWDKLHRGAQPEQH